jgi:PAS domain-containing protein
MATDLLAAILDSLRDPVLVADPAHVICYMNRAAVAHYQQGASLLGTSLLACHNAESQRVIHEVWEAMHHGLEERLITGNHKVRIFMRAVRGPEGDLLGYYERYEPKAATGLPAEAE